MEYIFLVVFVASVVMYLTDRKGWHATAKRLTTIVRANIEAGKPVKAIEPVKQFDEWENSFKSIENPPSAALVPAKPALKHVIVKTWYEAVAGSVRPHWKCRCGRYDWELDLSEAHRLSKRHVKEQNAAEELLAKNGGTHAW